MLIQEAFIKVNEFGGKRRKERENYEERGQQE